MASEHRSRRIWLAACGLALLSTLAAAQAALEPKRVLLLNSYGSDFAPFDEITATFRSELASRLGSSVELLEFSLQSARSGAVLEDEPHVEYLQSLYSAHQPDLVVPVGGPAVRFVQRQRHVLFPQVPMLLAAVDQRLVQEAALTDADTVVAVRNDLPGLMRNILEVLPGTTHVAVVVGASPLEKYWAQELHRELQPYMKNIEFTWFDQLTFEQMKRRVASLPPHSAILYALLLVDVAGYPNAREQGLRVLHDVANAPIFSIYTSQLGMGAVGGRLISDKDLGDRITDVAVRILHGETPGDIKVPPLAPGNPTYDWNELRRWGISESSLPIGSSLQFRERTMWERYRLPLTVGIGLLLLETALIAGFISQRIQRRRAEGEAVSLTGRLLMVHENERRRIARELHDDVTQRLAALAIESARHGSAKAVRDGLVSLSEDVHALSYRLHPSVIEDLGLVEALKAECDRVARTAAVAVSFESQGIPRRLPQDESLCLFRIAQEALRNVVRHSGASTVQVSLAPMEDGLHLAISDNGGGFDMDRSNDHPSLGLASMRERVHLLKGEVDIESSPGHGTTVIAWIPLQASPA